MLSYAVTIFLSAFLLFQVQPLISKYILPWFGGGPSVWTTCMVFFQVVLLAGYAYAHALMSWVKPRRQVIVHGVVLAAAAVLAFLRLPPSASWKPPGGVDPTWRILALLAATVGLPYFVVSTTSSLLQAWFSRTNPGKSPYRLYALSNVGSLLGLLTFPVLFEPWFGLSTLFIFWSVAFLLFAGACGYSAAGVWRTRDSEVVLEPVAAPAKGKRGKGREAKRTVKVEPETPPTIWACLLWLALPACGTTLLLAMTNRMCQDIAVVPFLWILPLSLYLLSFIICFERDKWYFRPLFWPAFILALIWAVYLLFQGVREAIQWQVAGLSICLFICCMVCHGELVRLRPTPRYLTLFYLLVSAGGAMGGIFVGIVSPLIFRMHLELNIGLTLCPAFALLALGYSLLAGKPWREEWLPWLCVGIALSLASVGGLGFALYKEADQNAERSVWISRSFFGVLYVKEFGKGSPYHHYTLYNGQIQHGAQVLSQEGRQWATTYYGGPKNGLEVSIRQMGAKRVAMIGLGMGTTAAHARKGDHYTFYDINPQVTYLAENMFYFLKDARARGAEVDVVMGDARLSLEREEPQEYDVLGVDAFTSDAIPVHLLTWECFQTYKRHLKDEKGKEGVLAIHISNRYLDLRPVCMALADEDQSDPDRPWRVIITDDKGEERKMQSAAHWVLLTRNKAFVEDPVVTAAAESIQSWQMPVPMLWTDDYSNLFRILYRPR